MTGPECSIVLFQLHRPHSLVDLFLSNLFMCSKYSNGHSLTSSIRFEVFRLNFDWNCFPKVPNHKPTFSFSVGKVQFWTQCMKACSLVFTCPVLESPPEFQFSFSLQALSCGHRSPLSKTRRVLNSSQSQDSCSLQRLGIPRLFQKSWSLLRQEKKKRRNRAEFSS